MLKHSVSKLKVGDFNGFPVEQPLKLQSLFQDFNPCSMVLQQIVAFMLTSTLMTKTSNINELYIIIVTMFSTTFDSFPLGGSV